jgi:hypothetical protein
MSNNRRIYSEVSEVGTICPTVRNDMFRILDRYYDCVNFNQFESDFKNKTYAILLRNDAGQLVGFSTLEHWHETIDGQALQFVFSGDTIIEHDYWGGQTFAASWIRLVARLKLSHKNVPMYWFLIVKGHRTYRYLPNFSKSYFPAPNIETPAHIKRLIDHLCVERFGAAYYHSSGTVRFEKSMGHLKEIWSEIDPADLAQEPVQFFLQRNPRYKNGEELACLTEVSAENMRPFARRIYVKENSE